MSKPKDESGTRRLNKELLAMVSIANAMLQATDLDQILRAITQEVGKIIAFDRSSVALPSPDKKSLIIRHIYKGGDEALKFGEGREIPIDETSVIGWVAIHHKPLLRKDVRSDTRFKEMVAEENLQSDMVVPLIARGKLFGTLNVGCHEPNKFSESDLAVIENCGKFTSLAIERTLLLVEAQELGSRYKTLQENANDIIMLIDRNTGRLVEVNRKCETAFGYTREDLLKRSYFDLFAQEDQYQARRDFINILSQKSKSFVDRRMISKDGNFIFVDINANLIKLKDDIFIQMIVHNISQRKMLEQQIIHQNKHLQEVNKKLREVDKMKTEFLANISHELRTPLSIILAYSESLRDQAISKEDHKKFLDVIAENGENLLTLINNLLELSKLEISGRMLSFTLSHIHDVINSVWPQMEKRAKTKKISLLFKPASEVPVIYFDNNQLVQVISCLIQNAIKFTEEGGSVEVRTRYKERQVWVTVIDTGMGIPSEEIPHIFETFHQVDGSSSRRWGGLGIGLALAKHIVELHKGQLWAESEYGKGSTFNVVLPVNTEEIFLRDTSGMVEVRNADQ